MELRKWICSECENIFYVDCDATDYPDYCPYCQAENIHKDTTAKTVMAGEDRPVLSALVQG